MILPNRSSMNGNTTQTACNKMTKKFIDIKNHSRVINDVNYFNLLPCIDKDSNVGPGLEAKSNASDADDNYDYIPPDLR